MKRYLPDLAILVVPLLIALVAYQFLPTQIPMQWRSDGSIRYADKVQIFLVAALPFVIYEARKLKQGNRG